MKVFLIAGEPSGDQIGAEIISALKTFLKSDDLFGIGGGVMLRSGLKNSLFRMEEISVMGFFEILPKIFHLRRLISKTVLEILRINPDIVITIDSPGFNVRVVNALRKAKFKGKIYHAVAPTVWAYKAKRAKQFAKIYDKLFCILPFEPEYFIKEGLDAKYICYPPLFRLLPVLKKAQTKETYFILMLGSRESEILHHLQFGKDIVCLIKQKIPEVKFVLPTLKNLEHLLLGHFPNEIIVTGEGEKIKYLQMACFSISKSGTCAVENAFFGIPSVVFYKVNWLSFLAIKLMIKIKFVNLINIILNTEAIPEFIQSNAKPSKIAEKVVEIYRNPSLVEKQIEAIEVAKSMLLSGVVCRNFGEGVVKNL